MKQTVDYKYLNFVQLTKMESWDVKFFLNKNGVFNSSYPLVLFGYFLKKPTIKKIQIKDNEIYNILGVRSYGKGVFSNRIVRGNTLKMRTYYKAKPNHLFWCKVDTKNGAFGVIKDDMAEGVGSTNMTFAEIDTTKINIDFLQLLFTSKGVINYLDGFVTGTTNRKYIKLDQLLNEIKIPLPSLAEQEAIVKAYQTKIQQAQDLEQQAQNLEQEIEKYFLNELGIEKKEEVNSIKKGLQIFQFKDLDRWDIWVNKNQTFGDKYKPIKFGDIVLGKPTYGANVKGIKKKSDTRYIRITDINDNGTLNKEFVSPEFVEEKYLLKENDFLIARSGNTVGKTFLFKEKYGRAIYAGYLVRYRLNADIVLPEYIFVYTKSYLFKQWVISNQRVAGQPNINGQEYLQAPIIIPPLDIQQNIVNEIGLFNKQKQKLYSRIETLKHQAEQEFEQALFN
ncbi:restriction endonuclease subunit S [Riemerella columbina]|uniref:restriction endonuclease subunit S n=1 Tax=Riemerella columbina TaxID=103810 RepID=UPI00036DB0F2|nr:restriction endonuclease subunit S [Riemerella columbina]